MIRDFKKTKENLREIADVINSFKSEAVQLRLLELVLSMEDKEAEVIDAVTVKVEEVKPTAEKVKAPRKKRVTKEKVVVVEEKKKETRGRKKRIVEVVEAPAPVIVIETKPAPKALKTKVKKEAVKKEKVKKEAVKKEAVKKEAVKKEAVIKEVVKKEKVKKESKPKAAKIVAQERPGPSVILRTLVADKYFAENRTIGQVVKHCLATYNFQYASTDLSGTLARLVKDNILKRVKNVETNTFEYSMA